MYIFGHVTLKSAEWLLLPVCATGLVNSLDHVALTLSRASWQAVYLDVVLIFPQLARSIVGPSNQFVPSGLAETCANTVFYTILFSCLYSVGSNIIGKTPNQLPVISEAVEGQMPF